MGRDHELGIGLDVRVPGPPDGDLGGLDFIHVAGRGLAYKVRGGGLVSCRGDGRSRIGARLLGRIIGLWIAGGHQSQGAEAEQGPDEGSRHGLGSRHKKNDVAEVGRLRRQADAQ